MGIYNLFADNKDLIIGAALAIGGNLLISIAMNVQKYSLTELQREEAAEAEQAREDPMTVSSDSHTNQSSLLQKHKYLKSKLWWAGITLMVLGEVGNFMAYGFAPATVVAPLGTTTVVANTYIAIFFLGENFRCQDALGTIVIVVGAFLIVMFSTSHDGRYNAKEIYEHLVQWPFLIYVHDGRYNAKEIYEHLVQWPFLIYVGVEIFLFIATNMLLYWREIKHVVLYILPAALLGGYVASDKTSTWVKHQLESSPSGKKLIFLKDMACCLDQYHNLPTGFRHTFLIRHPYKVFNSWKRAIVRGIRDDKKFILSDLPISLLTEGYFYREIRDLYIHVKENFEPDPVIIDIDDLLADPGRVLKAYCDAVDIPYQEGLLKWKPGQHYMDKLWKITKEHIYILKFGDIHKETSASVGFGKPSAVPDRESLPDDVLYYADASMPYNDELYANRLH